MRSIVFLAVCLSSLSFNAFAGLFSNEIKGARIQCEPKVEEKKTEEVKKAIDPSLITEEQIKVLRLEMKELALKKGLKPETAALAQTLEFDTSTAKKETTQPELTLTFDEYFKRTMPEYKILDAKKFLIDNWDELEKIEKEYEVDKEIIVSLMLIETYFGRILGNYNIMNSLFTLTLTSPRSNFWKTELLNVFELIDRGDTLYNRETKGSWAGAVGMVQFIPSSFMKLARDGTGNGKIDTISSKVDAFASAANYLKLSGWKYQKPYLREIKNSDLRKALKGRPLCEVAGLDFEDGVLVVPDKKLEILLSSDKKLDTRAFIAYNNFSVILKWNRALFFSVTAGIIFNELKDVSKNHS